MIRALILSRDPAWYGGVVNFVEVLKKNLSGQVVAETLRIGRRKRGVGRWLGPAMPIVDAARLVWLVSRKRYDVVHVNPSLDSRSVIRDGLFALILKILGQKGILVFVHGWQEDFEQRLYGSAVYRALCRAAFGGRAEVIVLARRFREALLRIGFDPGRVRAQTTMFDGTIIPRDCGRDSRDPYSVLFLSRFVREKGVFELIKAFKDVRQAYPQLTLVLAGTGPEESRMRQLCRELALDDWVQFVGYVRDQEKRDVLCRSGIFAFPTYYAEGCPVALLEAMAAGMPVLTASAGGIPDVFRDGENGVLLDEVTVESVRSALLSMLRDPDQAASVGEHNRAVAWSRYEGGVVSRDLEKVYEQLAHR